MKRLEIERSLMGYGPSGTLTSDSSEWTENTSKVHNILVLEYDDDGDVDPVIDLDIPERYELLANMVEQTVQIGIMMGIISAQ